MSAALKPITLDEFLEWEAEQEERFEFDGIQPVAMTGVSFAHARLVTQLILALGARLRPGCMPLANDMKVVTEGRVRYPDVTVVCGPVEATADRVSPTVIFEVSSRSTALTDRRVKSLEYAKHSSVMVYVTLEQTEPMAVLRRRGTGWQEEPLDGADAVMRLPEIGVELPLSLLYG